MKNQKGIAPIAVVLIIIGVLALGGGGYYAVKKFQKPAIQACTQEAKQCPDGSYVSRTGPNCEFSACPDITKDWKTYRNEEYGFKFKYPVEYKTIEHKDGWPSALVLLMRSSGYAQSFDLAVELWDNEFEFKKKYGYDPDIIKKINNKYITLWNINKEKDIEKIIFTFHLIQENESIDWRTYRNNEYGFEFQYPKNWEMSELVKGEKPIIDFIIASGMYTGGIISSSSGSCFDKENKSGFIDCAEYIEVQLNYSRAESITELLNNTIKYDSYINVEKIPNINGIKYDLKAAPYYKYMKFLNENYYVFILYYCDLNVCKSFDIFNQILSTFKFIE